MKYKNPDTLANIILGLIIATVAMLLGTPLYLALRAADKAYNDYYCMNTPLDRIDKSRCKLPK